MGGKTDVVKGRIKEAAGVLTGNPKLRAEGKTDQAIGKVKQIAKRAVDRIDRYFGLGNSGRLFKSVLTSRMPYATQLRHPVSGEPWGSEEMRSAQRPERDKLGNRGACAAHPYGDQASPTRGSPPRIAASRWRVAGSNRTGSSRSAKPAGNIGGVASVDPATLSARRGCAWRRQEDKAAA